MGVREVLNVTLILAATSEIQKLKQEDGFYGLVVSTHLYELLEQRTIVVRGEVPITNSIPVGVDKTLSQDRWEKVATREEWLKRVGQFLEPSC